MARYQTYKINIVLQLLWLCVICNYSYSQGLSSANLSTLAKQGKVNFLVRPFQNNVFIKEQGQFSRTSEKIKEPFAEPVLYGIENPEFNAYFTLHGIIFQFPERKNLVKKARKLERKDRKEKKEEEEQREKEEQQDEKTVETIWHTATMLWVNSNPSVEIIPESKVSDYYNYDSYEDTKAYDHVPAYKKIKYVDLYPGVDAEFELSEEGGIKYKLLVKPNVVVPAIAFKWEGLEKMNIDEKGNLNLKSKFFAYGTKSKWELLDHAPNAFSATSHAAIPVTYNLSDNKVAFKFSSENIHSEDGIVIDPWITNPNFPSVNKAFDIQKDSVGNVFIIGNNTNWDVQKYNSSGILQWTYVTYAVLMGDIAVDNPGNTYIVGGYSAGKRQKLDTAGVQLWSFSGLEEEWRLAFNYSKTILSEGGYFIDPGSNNLCKLDINTGAVSNEIVYGAETRGVATDCNGDIYSIHVTSGYSAAAGSNVLKKTNSNFTPAGSVGTGFLLSEAQPAATAYGLNPAYSASETYQVLNALTVNGPYVFIYDGATIRRINKVAMTIINSVSVPGGTVTMCGGIVSDLCGNIYAGTTNGIAEFDSSLTYVSTIPTPDAVYDVIQGNSGDLLACGNGFVGSFAINCAAPAILSATLTSTDASCKGGTASTVAVGGTPPYSYSWLPGGQSTATVIHLAAGTYTCIVTDPFCRSFIDSVKVNPVPPLVISQGVNSNSPQGGAIVNESCPNSFDGSATVKATGGKPPYLYYWNTTPIQTGATAMGLSAGIYLATVVDADTCKDTLSIVITHQPKPIADFRYTKVCNGNPTQFTDTSLTAAGTINSWAWDFGDGSTVNTNQNPSHIYASAGNYTVTLIAHNNFECADTITKSVKVYYNPVADFTFSNVCFKDSMYFNNTSSVDISTSIGSYLWSFGDGSSSSSLKNPSHDYASAATFLVTLLVTTIDGCTDVKNSSVKVFDPPISAFTASNTCLLDSARTTNASLNPAVGTIANWSWNFGDGSPLNSTLWNPSHLYATPGNYQITLITHSSNLGCPDTLTDSIHVFPMPLADFGFTNICLNRAMNFNDLSNVSSGSVTAWAWDFGDATPLNTAQNPSHIYTAAGSYVVTLIVTTNNGCKDTVTKNVIVHPLPSVLFSTSNVCLGSVTNFINTSSIPANPANDIIQSWIWNYADVSPIGTNQNPSHTYSVIGSYVVKLIAVSNFGCSDSVIETAVVNPNPVVGFTANDTVGCEPLCVTFQNNSSIATGGNAHFLWDLGDGNLINNSQDLVHCYSNDSVFAPNFFTVTLTVTSDSGCVTIKSKNNYITVYPKPNASFTVQPQTATITNPVVSITDLSTGANFWSWNFGNHDTTSIHKPNPQTYADTGTYIITLITSTLFSCIDTAYQTVIIEPDFMFYIPNAFTPDGDGLNDTFTGKGIFIKEFEMSIFDRWGNLVYQTDDINKPWDGRANHGSEIAQRDVYVYVVKVTDFKNGKHTYKGTVTLVR
jgi:gliding motility-associated-like protein